MIPQKNEKVTFLTLTTRNQAWVVKEEVVIPIDDVEIISNDKVRLTATVHGRQFYCERTFNPSTLDDLRASVWRPVVYGRSSATSDYLFVEAVVAFNVHRELGKRSDELVCDRSLLARTAVVPHAHNGYCATHDRVHYWSERCPKCISSLETPQPKMLAA